MRETLKRFNGFTIVELMVVVCILGIVIALFIPAIGAARRAIQERQGDNIGTVTPAESTVDPAETTMFCPHCGKKIPVIR